MRFDELYKYILKIKSEGDLIISSTSIAYGDSYYREDGQELKFTIGGKNYSVGHSFITEDDDTWAQAECHEVNWCRCDDEHIDTTKLFNIIDNYKSIQREFKLKELGI